MKMHSRRFKDPLIAAARPITILGPLIEESLRLARVRPNRELLVERFMAGHPRIAVVHGSEDHPSSVGCRSESRRLVRQIWAEGGLPVEVSQAVPSEELSRRLPGVHYAFLSRNVCSTNFGTLMESHGYDAAIVLGACDKLLVGVLRALAEADLARQRRKGRPVYAVVIPSSVGPEVYLNEGERRRFEEFRERFRNTDAFRLFSLIERPLNSQVYEKVKVCLDEAFHKRAILESEKDELEQVVAMRSLSPGADSGSSEASVVTRLTVAAFGVVPRGLDLSLQPPTDGELVRVVRRLLQGIEKRERKISVAHLLKANLQNSVSVWSSIGGDPSWLLHLRYLAEGVGARISPTLLGRRLAKVPRLLSFDPGPHGSVSGIAVESDAGGNSGIDTLMRTLSEKRFIDDRVSTLDGPWMQRIMEARSANGNYFHSTITPRWADCGLYVLHGNLAGSALARLELGTSIESYDRKIYLADCYLGHEELLGVIEQPGAMIERVRKKATQADLAGAAWINWGSGSRLPEGMLRWDKKRVWEFLVEQDLLRIMVFVAGEGPRASGMPQIWCPECKDHEVLSKLCVLATDGRTGFPHPGLSVSHIVPEAIEGGGLSAVRAGDWVYLNLRKGELQVVRPAKRGGFRPLSERELRRRVESRRRVQELERRKTSFLPSVRSLLDAVSSATAGVSPLG